MGTKVTILGEGRPKGGKKIEFVKTMLSDGFVNNIVKYKPNRFDNIVLISRRYTIDGLDLMYAYNNGNKDGCHGFNALYLGHFNDGIV